MRYQNQFWPDVQYTTSRAVDAVRVPERQQQRRAAGRVSRGIPRAIRRRRSTRAYGIFYDNHITGIAGITDVINGGSTGADARRRGCPRRSPHGTRPATACRSAAGGFPSLVISIDPGLETPYAHHVSVGVDRELPGQIALSANFVYVARLQSARDDRLQPDRAGARRRPAAAKTSAAVAGHLGLGASVHRLWRDVVPRPDAVV